ncbi:hypothetical protein PO909_006290, partial [Leuciscus waleckii]
VKYCSKFINNTINCINESIFYRYRKTTNYQGKFHEEQKQLHTLRSWVIHSPRISNWLLKGNNNFMNSSS